MKFVTGLLSALALTLFAPDLAQAQAASTFVSRFGNDANDCTISQPCKLFGNALPKTTVNGEIACLDSGSTGGSFAINQSVTIDCHEAYASASQIQINFDNFAANDTRKTVRLRNIKFNGGGVLTNAILIIGAASGTSVVIEDCEIEGFGGGNGGRGIDDQRSGGGKLLVTNTTIRNNGGAGISVLPTGGSSNIQVLLNNVRSFQNGTGAQFGNLTRVMIDQSAFTANTGVGILAVAGAIVDVDRSTMSHNANGVQAIGGVIALANSNIKLNTTQGLNVSGGTVVSFGNNRIAFNASPGTPPNPAGSVSNNLGQQ